MGNEYKKVISEKKSEAGRLMTSKQLSECNIAIHTAAAAAAASGAIPIPGVDAIPISAAQITMVIALGKVFDQKLTDSAAKGIISAAASTFVGRNLVKMVPIAGWVVSAAVAAGVTEAIGWSVATDFARMYKKDKIEVNEVNNMDHTVSSEDIVDTTKDSAGDFQATDEATDDQGVQEVETEDSDDESIANDIAKVFEEEEER